MKMDCPACGHICSGQTELEVEQTMVAHIRDNPNRPHNEQLEPLIEDLERHIVRSYVLAKDSADVRQSIIYDKAADIDSRLRLIYLHAGAFITVLRDATLSVLIEARRDGSITQQNSGKRLFQILNEAGIVLRRKY